MMRMKLFYLVFTVFLLFTLEVSCHIKNTKRKSSIKITQWTPQLIMNSTNYRDGLIDPEFYFDNFEDKNKILNLMDDIKRTKNIDVYLIIITEMNDSYFLKGKKDINRFVDELSALLVNRNKKLDADSFILMFSVNDKQMKIRTGLNVKKVITNKTAQDLLSQVKSYLRNGDYTGAATQILQRSYDKLNGGFSLFSSGGSSGNGSSFGSTVLLIFICVCCCPCICMAICCGGIKGSGREAVQRNPQAESKLERIKEITNRNQGKKEFLESSCVICLEDLPKPTSSNHEAIQVEGNLPTLNDKNPQDNEEKQALIHNSNNDLNTKNKVEIAKLDCGHTFHQLCIADWMEKKNVCPVCRSIIDPDSEKDSKPIQQGLVEIQRDLHPELNSYNYNYSNSGFNWIPIPIIVDTVESYHRYDRAQSSEYQRQSSWGGDWGGGWNNDAGGADDGW